MHIAERLALARARDGGDEPHLGMPEDKTRELSAGIAGDADDRHADGHDRNYAALRIFMQTVHRPAAYGKMPRFSMALATRSTATMNAASRSEQS